MTRWLSTGVEADPGKVAETDYVEKSPSVAGLRLLRPPRTHHGGGNLPDVSRSHRNHGPGAAIRNTIDGMVCELSPRGQSEGASRVNQCTRPSTVSLVTTEKMSENPKRYWMSPARSAGDLENASREIPTIGEVNGDPDFITTRRSFLKAAGFTFIGAVAASCSRAPALSVIPYVQQPEQLVPGRPVLYASTCDACEARCGLLVTTGTGGRLKIEGNPDHPLSSGATCAVGQASILGLYDGERLAYPTRRGQRSTWSDVDKEITTALDRIRQQGGAVRTSDSNDHQPDDFCPDRRVPRDVQERETRQLRCDLRVGRARRPCADAWRPPPSSLPV